MTQKPHDLHTCSTSMLLRELQKRIVTGALLEADLQMVLHQESMTGNRSSSLEAAVVPRRNMREIREQEAAKRALEVAAAGGHNVLLVGSPGAGKHLLAHAFSSVLPTAEGEIPVRIVYGAMKRKTFAKEVFRAHTGVLLLEDLTEFKRSQQRIMQTLMETRCVSIGATSSPAWVILVGIMQPCPCGFSGDPVQKCYCSVEVLESYQNRLRAWHEACFDLYVEVPRLRENLLKLPASEDSATHRHRVEAARDLQHQRYTHTDRVRVNADLQSVEEVLQFCEMDRPSELLLKTAHTQLDLTPHRLLRILTVARTCADLAGSQSILAHHLAEAIFYQSRLEREQTRKRPPVQKRPLAGSDGAENLERTPQ